MFELFEPFERYTTKKKKKNYTIFGFDILWKFDRETELNHCSIDNNHWWRMENDGTGMVLHGKFIFHGLCGVRF